MPLPRQDDIEIPLLEEIAKAGGKARPKDLYPLVTAHFPAITQQDLSKVLDAGNNQWINRIQWARQALVQKGHLDGSTRGVWAITQAGRQRLDPQSTVPPPTEASVSARRQRKRPGFCREHINHDELAHALERIGRAFGFETLWKPKVNDLRPDKRAFKSKRKTLDVAWGIANLTWVAIEVQVGGSVADLIYRFQQVHQWSLRLVVVTVPAYSDEIREAIHDYPFRDKVVLLEPGQVWSATKSVDRLLTLRATIFE